MVADLPKKESISIKHNGLKRAFDILFTLFLFTLFFPIFFLLSLLILLTSKGPVFYKSPRIGRGGKIIHCWKFRTMYQNAEEKLQELLDTDPDFSATWEKFQKVKKDPRITPVGKFLRKYSLDEIPQFWNVLKGDLSMVGPRPPTLLGPPEKFFGQIAELYGEETPLILSVRPGMTGLWQVSGRSDTPFEQRRQMEAEYAKSRTFLKDLWIICKTIPAVFFSRGAF